MELAKFPIRKEPWEAHDTEMLHAVIKGLLRDREHLVLLQASLVSMFWMVYCCYVLFTSLLQYCAGGIIGDLYDLLDCLITQSSATSV